MSYNYHQKFIRNSICRKESNKTVNDCPRTILKVTLIPEQTKKEINIKVKYLNLETIIQVYETKSM